MDAFVGVVLAGALVSALAPHGGPQAIASSKGDETPFVVANAPRQTPLGCLRVLAPLAQYSIPDAGNFERAECAAGAIKNVFRYDRSGGVTRLARDVTAGETVPIFPEFDGDVVVPGEMLDLVTAVGAVRVERQVEAMQAARPGEKLFVRSPEGQILSVRYEAGPR